MCLYVPMQLVPGQSFVPRASAEEQTSVSVNGTAKSDGSVVDFDELTDLIRYVG